MYYTSVEGRSVMARFEVIGRRPSFDEVVDEVETTKEAHSLIRELKKFSRETGAGYVAFFLRPKGYAGIPGVAA
tara:strand:- start:40 stop:261 length:222 start_codon:yes stop_codon:yes gene_type:complete